MSAAPLPIKQAGLRTFYALAIAQTISQIGSRMSALAVGIYIYAQTGQATPLALIALFQMLPTVIGGGIAGVLADRLDRRLLMVVGDTGAAVGSLALLISVASGSFEVWHIYVITAWQSLFGVLQGPAFQSSITQLVPESQRHRANAILQIGGPAAGLIAPALTGLLYIPLGINGIILIDMATFLIGVTAALLVRIPPPPRTEHGSDGRQSMLADLGAAFAFLWQRRPLFIHIMQITLINFFIGSVFALLTPYLLARTGSEPTTGVLLAILNVGGLAGAIIIGIWGGFTRRIDTVMAACVLALAGSIGLGIAQSVIGLALGVFAAMFGISIINTAFMTMLQSKIPGDMQGRVFALLGQLAAGLMPLGYLLVGPLADQVFKPLASGDAWANGLMGSLFGMGAGAGMGVLFTLGSSIALVITLVVYALPSVRQMESRLPTYSAGARPDAHLDTTPDD